jgi:hypothetical protein
MELACEGWTGVNVLQVRPSNKGVLYTALIRLREQTFKEGSFVYKCITCI